MLSSRWPLWTRSASKALPACRACHPEPPPPEPGTAGTRGGTSSRDFRPPLHACRCLPPPATESSKSVRVSLVQGTEGIKCEVRFGAISFAEVFFGGTGEKKVNFLEAPLPVSSDEASKSSRLKALRWRKNQTRPVLEKRSSITVVLTASREIGRNISFRCAFFGIYGFILLPLVVLVVSNRNLCAQVFFFSFFLVA